MTRERRYQIECVAFTLAVCAGVVWLVGDKVWHRVKSALL
jgi:hypothetical protein